MNGLMARYKKRVPDVQMVIDAMIREQVIEDAGDIENDHTDFCTIAVPFLGIQSFEKYSCIWGTSKKTIIMYWKIGRLHQGKPRRVFITQTLPQKFANFIIPNFAPHS